jgi:isopentenyl-diphosphate delta-isomerase
VTSTGASPQRLILVDPTDTVLGAMEREACHVGEGVLHRAFSILLFDSDGRVLLQQRSPHKRLWPGYWSNSCCGHPLVGEQTDVAAQRRLGEELGIQTPLAPAFQFQYAADFEDRGAERELCSVFFGQHEGSVSPAADEISDWGWESPRALTDALLASPSRYTPWFRVIWRVIGLPASAWGETDPEKNSGSRKSSN